MTSSPGTATAEDQKKKKKRKKRKKSRRSAKVAVKVPLAKFPRHSVAKSLRIPKAILKQNAGRPCTVKQAAEFVGVGASGPFAVEVSSSCKYGFLHRTKDKKIAPTELAKKVIRPKNPRDEIEGMREAILRAPELADVYQHYRGENIPDDKFFANTAVDTCGIPADKVDDFKVVFLESLDQAKLLTKDGERSRVLDFSSEDDHQQGKTTRIRMLEKRVRPDAGDTCFVMQPFASPYGEYYETVYEPAIKKAGLTPVRADADIFCTGKIMDQVSNGIREAKVLVAELTSRNPNVFYELGLAHAWEKPVVLVSSNDNDVPFDLKHIRVIYYVLTDPFWGSKLIDKVAENILSAIENPEEAIFKGMTESTNGEATTGNDILTPTARLAG